VEIGLTKEGIAEVSISIRIFTLFLRELWFGDGWFLIPGCQSPILGVGAAHTLVKTLKGSLMSPTVETFTPANTPKPIGPYNHIAKVGQFISIGGTAGVDPATGQLAGPDVNSQTKQILESFKVMLESAGSDLQHIVHVNIFLKDMRDFEEMNKAYIEVMEGHRPARTVIGVNELPKPGVLLTMNLTAVTRE
jgi:2-iminobutanoate/2-iminopropanoate deaminase